MAGARNYHSLLAARFLLGLFEAVCLPLFTFVVSNWYRRAEQPLRIAAFYSTNGIACVFNCCVILSAVTKAVDRYISKLCRQCGLELLLGAPLSMA